jgi:hypothetical protein
MAAVRMYIDKFACEVLIDEDHPLAVAQKQKPVAEVEPELPPELKPIVAALKEPVALEAVPVPPVVPPKSKKKR